VKRNDAGTLLAEARHRRGLTQRELATRAGVPQSTIAAIEAGRRNPTVDLLTRIAERGRLGLGLRVTRAPRDSAAATGRRVAEALTTADHDPRWREDAALRAVLDLRDRLLRADDLALAPLVADPPGLSGSGRWDAFIAGVVEEICCRADRNPPPWTQEPERFTRPFWYLADGETFREWERLTVPAALLRHGVLAAAKELESV
jgi:transcriptional regulator with XRE-family HTH domain